MATQDTWTRINFRLPPDLHQRLKDTAEETGSSINAEVIRRLFESFWEDETRTKNTADRAELDKLAADVSARIDDMAKMQREANAHLKDLEELKDAQQKVLDEYRALVEAKAKAF